MMHKREAIFWDFLKEKMGNRWDVQRHEDKFSTGIPDLSYGMNQTNGWIELKACSKWPTKGIPYYTPVQANWLAARGKRGGHCFILIKVNHKDGYTILLFSWAKAYLLLGDLDEAKMREEAIVCGDNVFPMSEFLKVTAEWIS